MTSSKDIEITGINHVCLVVKDLMKSKHFFVEIIGLQQHPKIDSWLIIHEGVFLHLVTIPEASVDNSLYHEIQHFALQVKDLKKVQLRLLEFNLKPYQMDFNGNVQDITTPEDGLLFGIGTIFVTDPDGNLIEFIELGKGVFSEKGASN